MDIGGTSGTGKMTGAAPATPAHNPDLEKAAKAFEAVFLRQMIGAMRSASLSEGLFDSSSTEQFRDMADARTADSMAENSNFGIADLLIRQFSPKVPLTTQSAIRPELSIGGEKGDGQ